MDKIAETLDAARTRLEEQQNTIEEQQEKLAEYERMQLAEEIAELKVASNSIEPQDFIEERDRLVNSDKNLERTKIAMKEAGPKFDGGPTVNVGDEGTDKEASRDTSSSQYHESAQQNLQETLSEMGAA